MVKIMKKFWHNFVVAAALSALPMLAQAQTTGTAASTPKVSDEEAQLIGQFCSLPADGVLAIADLRQRNVPKSEALSELNTAIDKFNQNNKDADKDLVNQLKNYLTSATDFIYEQPIAATDDEKKAFVMNIAEMAFYDCVERQLSNKS